MSFNIETPSPIFGGSTGGWLRAAEIEEKYAITWTSPKEQIFEMPTGGAAIIVTNQVFDIKMQKTDPFIRGLLLILADRARQLTAKQSYSDVSSETESVTDSQAATDAASQTNA